MTQSIPSPADLLNEAVASLSRATVALAQPEVPSRGPGLLSFTSDDPSYKTAAEHVRIALAYSDLATNIALHH